MLTYLNLYKASTYPAALIIFHITLTIKYRLKICETLDNTILPNHLPRHCIAIGNLKGQNCFQAAKNGKPLLLKFKKNTINRTTFYIKIFDTYLFVKGFITKVFRYFEPSSNSFTLGLYHYLQPLRHNS